MDTALVADVVAEVMKRLGGRNGHGLRAGEDAPANEGFRVEAERRPHTIQDRVGQYGLFARVDDAVNAATESQRKLLKLSLDERDQIVKLIKRLARENASALGKMERAETKIG